MVVEVGVDGGGGVAAVVGGGVLVCVLPLTADLL